MLLRSLYTRLVNEYYKATKFNSSLINRRVDDNTKINIEAKMEVLGYKLLDIKLRGKKR